MNEPARDPDFYIAECDDDEPPPVFDSAEEAYDWIRGELLSLEEEDPGGSRIVYRVHPVWVGDEVPDPRRLIHA